MTENKAHIEFSVDTKDATAKLEALAQLAAKAGDAIDAATDIKRLAIEEGDTIVVRCDRALTAEMSRSLSSYVRDAVGKDIKVLVLDQGISIDVISADPRGEGKNLQNPLVS